MNPYKIFQESMNIPCQELAEYLLGKLVVRNVEGNMLKGRIVETECYLGAEDRASHSYGGKQTPRNQPMYMPAGTSYVYMTYGMYYCFNISSIEPGAAVLVRALQPVEGRECMKQSRNEKRPSDAKELKDTELCNGPAKLCIAFNINKDNCNRLNLCESDELWLEVDPEFDYNDVQIMRTSRIGVKSAGEEWANKPLRFYILNNPYVSKRDRKDEKDLLT